jgi:hypothetical protein
MSKALDSPEDAWQNRMTERAVMNDSSRLAFLRAVDDYRFL